jgi:hypothetical protein
MDIQRMGWGDMEWIDLAQDKNKLWAIVNAGMNLRLTQYAGNILNSLRSVSFSGRTRLHGVSYLVS